MPASHDLKGLMKFLARDKWRDCFEEVLDEHFDSVLDAADMDFEDLAGIVGDDWAMTLRGCAFEDFLTRDFDGEDGNIVDDYLRRGGWKEGAQAKVYMKALRNSVMSLYEVSDIVPGKSLMARDLIRGGEPIAVSEGTATQTLRRWDRIAARIVPVMDRHVFAGGLLAFTPRATDMLFGGLRRLFGKSRARKLPAIADHDLRAVAFLFTVTWLFDTLGRTMDMPEIRNADGDELLFHDVRFPLASGVTQKDIAARLSTIPGLSQENAKFWNWLGEKPKSGGTAKQADALSFDTIMDSGLSVLGTVELKGRFLHLSTNSVARADQGTALIGEALGDLVRAPLTEIRTVEQMMADRPPRDRGDAASDISPEIARQAVHAFMDRRYRETLDQPVEMLGNRTPRQAINTPAGRRKVVEWLKYLENQSARQPDPADPMATYSFEWMWKELGVLDLRR